MNYGLKWVIKIISVWGMSLGILEDLEMTNEEEILTDGIRG